jgi:hypothetical protein
MVLRFLLLPYCSIQRMEVVESSSETSVDFYQSRWCYIQEDSTPNTHRREQILTLLALYFLVVACLPNCLTLNMDTVCSSERSMNAYRAPRRHISDNSSLHTNACYRRNIYIMYFSLLEYLDGIWLNLLQKL